MKTRFLALALTSMTLISCGKTSSQNRKIKPIRPNVTKDVNCSISDENAQKQSEEKRASLISSLRDANKNLASKIYIAAELFKTFDSSLWLETCHNDAKYRDAMLGETGKEFFTNLHILSDEVNQIIAEKANKKIFRKKEKAIRIATEQILNPLAAASAHLNGNCDGQLCLDEKENKVAQILAISATMHLTKESSTTLEDGLSIIKPSYLTLLTSTKYKDTESNQLSALEEEIAMNLETTTIELLLEARVNTLLTIVLKEISDSANIHLIDENSAQAILTNKSELKELKNGSSFEKADVETKIKINTLLSKTTSLIEFIKENRIALTIESEISEVIKNLELDESNEDTHYDHFRLEMNFLKTLITGEGDISIDPPSEEPTNNDTPTNDDGGKTSDEPSTGDTTVTTPTRSEKRAIKKAERTEKREARREKREDRREERTAKREQRKADRAAKKDMSDEEKDELKEQRKAEKKEEREIKKEERKDARDAKAEERLEKAKAKYDAKVDKKNFKHVKSSSVSASSFQTTTTTSAKFEENKLDVEYVVIKANGKSKTYKNLEKAQKKAEKESRKKAKKGQKLPKECPNK